MGGNVFKNRASPIVRENIRPTYVEYVRHLGTIFPNKPGVFKNFTLVGSAGRKDTSGDLDLAIDMNCFFDGKPFNKKEMADWRLNYSEWEQLHLLFKSRARTSTDNMVKWRAFLKLLGDVVRRDGAITVSSKNTKGSASYTIYCGHGLSKRIYLFAHQGDQAKRKSQFCCTNPRPGCRVALKTLWSDENPRHSYL